MKTNRKPSPGPGGSARRRLEAKLKRLRESVESAGLLSQGSVVRNAGGRWMWTRKVAGKTVTVALSEEQSAGFKDAIQSNRVIEKALREIREETRILLLSTLPGPRRKTPAKPPKRPLS